MANRFWVGGTSTWNATAGSKWSLTSGGTGNQAVPTSSDDVFFDANSGTVAITLSGGRNCKSLTCTGFTGTFAMGDAATETLNVSGSVLFVSGMTLTETGCNLNIIATASITTGGKTMTQITLNGAGATFTLQDNFSSDQYLQLADGTLDANNKNVSVKGFICGDIAGKTITLTMGSGTWTMTGVVSSSSNPVWDMHGSTTPTISANTATIKFTDTSNTAIATKWLDLTTYHNIWFSRGTSTGTITHNSRFTVSDFKDDGTGTHTHTFQSSNTYTFTTFTVSGIAGHLITIGKSSAAAVTFSAASGIISRDYLNIVGNAAGGGATWYAGANSTDGGGNSGWIFTAPPAATGAGFLFNMI